MSCETFFAPQRVKMHRRGIRARSGKTGAMQQPAIEVIDPRTARFPPAPKPAGVSKGAGLTTLLFAAACAQNSHTLPGNTEHVRHTRASGTTSRFGDRDHRR